MGLNRHRFPFPQRRPLPLGQWRAGNQHAMGSQIVGYVNVNVNASGSGYHARLHSNINIIVNVVNVSRWP